MDLKLEVVVAGFEVPDSLAIVSPELVLGGRHVVQLPAISLENIPPEDLERLCKQFTERVLEKAKHQGCVVELKIITPEKRGVGDVRS